MNIKNLTYRLNMTTNWITGLQFLFLYAIAINTVTLASKENITCLAKKPLNNSDEFQLNDNNAAYTYITCSSYCYTYWREPSNSHDNATVLFQGCWLASGKVCGQPECISSEPSITMNDTRFCCCSTSFCNADYINIYNSSRNATQRGIENEESTTDSDTTSLTLLIWVVPICIILCLTTNLISLLFWSWHAKIKKVQTTSVHHSEHNQSLQQHSNLLTSTTFHLDKLALLNIIGQGRYGCVWRAKIDDQELAVKIFPPHHRVYYLNELEMFRAASSNEYSGVVQCFGGGEYSYNTDEPPDYLLLFALERECLQDFLKHNTIDLEQLAKMCLGIGRGMTHLHNDVGKPCIAHRDLNSRNILVRSDGTTCICDLGLAVVPKRNDMKTISEAGTLRYMAPEVLEGAVNLTDCENALIQIDIYALGLVLWELGTRCTSLLKGEPSPYALPFQAEIGENATLDQMQALVSRQKARPLWPCTWNNTSAARLFSETAEDCWDHDAEARLTAPCVYERLQELLMVKNDGHPYNPLITAINTPTTQNATTNFIHFININNNNNHLHHCVVDLSVGTMDTLLSPSEEICKNTNQCTQNVIPTVLQPHQGRNPCLERNLRNNTSSDTNIFIDKSAKHCSVSDGQDLITDDVLTINLNDEKKYLGPYVESPSHKSNAKSVKRPRIGWNFMRRFFHYNTTTPKSQLITNRIKRTEVSVHNVNKPKVTTALVLDKDSLSSSSSSSSSSSCEKNVQRPQHLSLNSSAGIKQLLKRSSNDSFGQQSNVDEAVEWPLMDRFIEVFSSSDSGLKALSERIKTPGDVPASVRRTRGKAARTSSARFSLFDDRLMNAKNLENSNEAVLSGEPCSNSVPELHDTIVLSDKDEVKNVPDKISVSSL